MSSYNSSPVRSSPGATKGQPLKDYTTTPLEKSGHLRPELQDGRDPDRGQAHPETQDASGVDPERQRTPPPRSKRPWYRTTWGITIIVVAVIIIVAAAIVGGVVGSKKKSDGSNDITAPQGSGSASGASSVGGTTGVDLTTATGDDSGDSGSTSSPTVPSSQGAAGGDQTVPADTPTPAPTPTDSQATPTQDPAPDSTQTPDCSACTNGPPGSPLPPLTTASATDSDVTTFDVIIDSIFTIHVSIGPGFDAPIAPVAPRNTATF